MHLLHRALAGRPADARRGARPAAPAARCAAAAAAAAACQLRAEARAARRGPEARGREGGRGDALGAAGERAWRAGVQGWSERVPTERA